MNNAVWIWYPGDFEIYHGMKQNFRREERGLGWPAFWKMDDWRKNLRFFRKYELMQGETFTVHGCGVGHVQVDGQKFPLEKEITIPAGKHLIEVFIGNMTGVPSIYVESRLAQVKNLNDTETASIHSDATWGVDDFLEAVPVGTSSLYTRREQDPNEVEYEEIIVHPQTVEEKEGGTLIDFGQMVDGRPVIAYSDEEFHDENEFHHENCSEADNKNSHDDSNHRTFTILYGESEDEALDPVYCYYKEENATVRTELRKRAFRYIYLPAIKPEEIKVHAVHQRVPLKVRASFSCDDAQINKIWEVSAKTYELCSGLFFIDGIKRDRWVWSGDAYQSMMLNPYLYFDKEIDKRTSRALRGNTEIRQHINTIVDYTMLWLISVQNEYMMDGDIAYVREMYPKMEAAMDLLFSQTDAHGFVRGRDRDWIYIDWADIDKDGPISAEQVLLWKNCKVMAYCAELLAERGEPKTGPIIGQNNAAAEAKAQAPVLGPDDARKAPVLGPDGRPLPADHVAPYDAPLPAGERQRLKARAVFYEEKAENLHRAIMDYYWDEEKGALIDSFTSGRRNVTRHANIFAVLFDLADEKQKEQIRQNVFYNENVPQITTPYFKFFELDALGKLGDLEAIWETLHSYWGGMIERGAVTFWELFDPAQKGREQYGMYGDPFGKSLCHAWGASPIYLLGRYFLGVKPTAPGYKTYEVKPAVQYFDKLDCTVPVGDKSVHIVLHNGDLTISEC
ncbi:MAG: alpha-L-rhamnosidase [Lachnospiraceae bacterium]|nr:alpha-L-rhamnosidase [Lachnospiraceae bacterium]